ncbi:tetratricopeptide repeat-containing sensor histidine kinase [Aquimarina sp. M1]
METSKQLKNIPNDRELLDNARDYLTSENEDRENAFRISHEILKRTNSENNIVTAYNILSSYHYRTYATDSALYYGKKALQLNKSKHDTLSLKSLSISYKLLSNASRDKNLIEDSKKWALKGIETAKKIQDLEELYWHTANLAITYRISGNIQKALEIFESTLEFQENPNSYGSIALCHIDLKNYTKAIFYHKKALDFYIADNNQRSVAISLMNIGAVYLEMGEGDKALVYFNKSLPIAKKHGYPLITLNNLINISEVFQLQKNFKKAIEGYTNVLTMAKQSGYFRQQLYVYDRLKAIALIEKQPEKVIAYMEKKIHLKDSINKIQRDEEVSKLEVEYETLKKEKEITVLKKNQELKVLEIEKQQTQKKTLTYAFIIIIIPLAGLLFLYYQKIKNQDLLIKKQDEIAKQKIKTLLQDQELTLIKTSVSIQDKERKRIAQELHDRIGGNLAAIKLQFSATAPKNMENFDFLSQQLDDTYKQVRMLSHDLIPEKFKQNNFTHLLKEYTQNIGNASELSIKISTYQEKKINKIDHSFQNNLFSVFQELITNTIKHANASNIQIQIDLIENLFHIIFEDDGKGFDTSNTSFGIGLSGVKNRIQKLSGAMHMDSRLGRGTIINIEIPKP